MKYSNKIKINEVLTCLENECVNGIECDDIITTVSIFYEYSRSSLPNIVNQNFWVQL